MRSYNYFGWILRGKPHQGNDRARALKKAKAMGIKPLPESQRERARPPKPTN